VITETRYCISVRLLCFGPPRAGGRPPLLRTAAPRSDTAARIAREFEGWAPELTALITDGESAPVLRPISSLPADHRWDRVPGVTLLGDAAHLMPPSGEGANLAMLDGAELGEALAAHPGDAEAALAGYERALFARSGKAAVDAVHIHDLVFGDDTPHGLIAMFTGTGRRREDR
jgi:2-polyprenyl-6-methoxyphenol hydroxylase-like FAD-dependent oxidoreductase